MSSFGGGRIDVARPILLDRHTVSYDVSCTSEMRKYFSGRGMFITYDADISIVPNALLLIPVLSTLAPIAWALGADLSAHSIDAGFLRALGDIQRSFQRLHPEVSWSGDVFGDEVVDTRTSYPGRERAILFSGGVDSVTSAVVHREEKPLLVTVWGADLGLAQQRRWDQVSASNWKFAQERSFNISFIKTNFRTFFNSYRLKPKYVDHFPNWYSAFQQGLCQRCECLRGPIMAMRAKLPRPPAQTSPKSFCPHLGILSRRRERDHAHSPTHCPLVVHVACCERLRRALGSRSWPN